LRNLSVGEELVGWVASRKVSYPTPVRPAFFIAGQSKWIHPEWIHHEWTA